MVKQESSNKKGKTGSFMGKKSKRDIPSTVGKSINRIQSQFLICESLLNVVTDEYNRNKEEEESLISSAFICESLLNVVTDEYNRNKEEEESIEEESRTPSLIGRRHNTRGGSTPKSVPAKKPSITGKGYSNTQILIDTLTNLTPEELHELVQEIDPKLFPTTGFRYGHPFPDGINLREILDEVEKEKGEGYRLDEMMDKLGILNRRFSDNYQAFVVMVFLIQSCLGNNPVLLPTELNHIECLTEEQRADLLNEEHFTKNHVMAIRYLHSLCFLLNGKNIFDEKKTKVVFLRASTFLFEGPFSSLVIGGASSRFTNLKIQIYHHVFGIARQQRGRPRS